jgi:cellulose synthase/poly-beta-1,6-N-acetylglucosamine synthase-like glycosyltransferase
MFSFHTLLLNVFFTTENFVPQWYHLLFAKIMFGIYIVSLTFTTIYCLMQFQLYYYYRKYRASHPSDPVTPTVAEADLPFVTVQLPMYNEMYVVEKLLDSIVQFDYPKDKYEIHVIDDSTDETIEIARARVAYYKAQGFNIEHIRRPNRQGFKAGALKDATPLAKGEFLAIFDADFEPRPEFLRRTVPFFQDPTIGVVQTRWEHINEDYSLITRLQTLPLNVHFTVEQLGRSKGGFLLQFNGTAGVWRKKTIEDAGGWESDTLTEDLDLSYRAQLHGYHILFLEKLGSPAELPAEMNAFKAQQHRWMKGGAESARKLLGEVWSTEKLSFWQKVQSTAHLMSSTLFLNVFLLGVTSFPVMHTLHWIGVPKGIFTIFMLGFFAMIVIYATANIKADISGRDKSKLRWRFLGLYPVFLSMSMGMALHNARAVLEGWRGKKSEFVRTPKFNIKTGDDAIKKGDYVKAKIKLPTIFEGILSFYFVLAIVDGLVWGNHEFLTFHLMLAFGYGAICYYTIKHTKAKAA